jgi:hypothetical protein
MLKRKHWTRSFILEEEDVSLVTAAASAPGIAADSALAPGTCWKRRAQTHA